jgi:hypothetical protein
MINCSAFRRLAFGIALTWAFLGLAPHAQAQTFPPVWSASSSYVEGDLVQLGGNCFRASKSVTGKNPNIAYNFWELTFVRNNTTLMIGTGQTFPTLASAWSYIVNARVSDGAYLHLYISSVNGDFSETFTTSFLLDQASGARVAILGDSSANDVLTFNGVNGLVIDTGHSFNTISGITIKGNETGGTDGIEAGSQSSISSLSSLVVDGFTRDIDVTQGANIVSAARTVVLSGFAGTAVFASTSASVVFPEGVAIDNGAGKGPTSNNYKGIALGADFGGQIVAPNSSLLACNVGAQAEHQGIIDISSATLENNYGVIATERGFVRCSNAHLTSVTLDLQAAQGGYIQNEGAAYTTKQSGGAMDGSYITN